MAPHVEAEAHFTPPPTVVHLNGAPVVMPKNWLEERQAQHRFFAQLHAAVRGELKSGT